MKNAQYRYRAFGHGHTTTGGSDSSHVPDGHLSDHTEYRDLDFRAIFQFMVGLIVIVAISYISMYGILKLFESNHEQNDPAPSPMAIEGWNNPGPEVQQAPHVDLENYRVKVDGELEGKEGEGMPIEEAMRDVVQEGLPYQEKSERAMTSADEDASNAAENNETDEAPADSEGTSEPASEE